MKVEIVYVPFRLYPLSVRRVFHTANHRNGFIKKGCWHCAHRKQLKATREAPAQWSGT